MADQAEIHMMAQSEDLWERIKAVNELCKNFEVLPDKNHAWIVLHQLAQDDNSLVRQKVADALGSAFPYILDKEQAWNYLNRLAQDKNSDVREHIATALGPVFSYIPDKKQAWFCLHRLMQEENDYVLARAANALGSAFPYIPDKEQAWDDLHRLTQEHDSYVLEHVADAMSSAFSQFPDKKQAWDDLIRLTQVKFRWDEDSNVRMYAASALGSAFPYIPDKEQAWADLYRLTQDEHSDVRGGIADALGSAFPYISDKNHAWNDLHRLTLDIKSDVRQGTASALGTAYPHIPDTEQAWADLHRLIQDEDGYVRACANHSLGKISIFKAIDAESEEKFRIELEKAFEFLEMSSREVIYFNPARFCLPFYRAFYTITFKKQEAEAEVQKYLAETRSAVGSSESKEKLLEAIDNLGNALKETQKALDFKAMKTDLNAYRRYLDRACELLDTTEEKAPGAARLIRKGLPIIDERIKGIIAEIQEKAKALCRKTRGTSLKEMRYESLYGIKLHELLDRSLEEMGLETVKQAKELSTSNELKIDKSLEMINGILNKFCEYVPADKRDLILEDLKKAKYLDIQGLFEATLKKLQEIYENFTIPPIITVPANKESKQKQDIVRIAAIQFGFQLTNSFPPALEKKEECKQKIISFLDTAKIWGAHIACLPELCMCEEWVQDLKNRYPDMIIIGGSYYKNDFNECPVIMNLEVPPQLKKSPSRPEDHEITGKGMKSGDKLYRYETHLGTFSVLVCIDFLNYARFCDQTDIIFCPSYNETKGVKRFHEYASAHVTNIPSYIIISNTALFGGTSIFGQLHKDYYRGLVENGCKKAEDNSYKLCDLEKGFEGIIIADFDLVHKSPQVPTPVDSNKVIKSIKNIRKIKIF